MRFSTILVFASLAVTGFATPVTRGTPAQAEADIAAISEQARALDEAIDDLPSNIGNFSGPNTGADIQTSIHDLKSAMDAVTLSKKGSRVGVSLKLTSGNLSKSIQTPLEKNDHVVTWLLHLFVQLLLHLCLKAPPKFCPHQPCHLHYLLAPTSEHEGWTAASWRMMRWVPDLVIRPEEKATLSRLTNCKATPTPTKELVMMPQIPPQPTPGASYQTFSAALTRSPNRPRLRDLQMSVNAFMTALVASAPVDSDIKPEANALKSKMDAGFAAAIAIAVTLNSHLRADSNPSQPLARSPRESRLYYSLTFEQRGELWLVMLREPRLPMLAAGRVERERGCSATLHEILDIGVPAPDLLGGKCVLLSLLLLCVGRMMRQMGRGRVITEATKWATICGEREMKRTWPAKKRFLRTLKKMPLAPGFKLKSGREELEIVSPSFPSHLNNHINGLLGVQRQGDRYHLPEGFARIACDLSARLPRWRGAVARGCAWGIVWDPHAAAMIMAGLTPAYGIGLDQSYDSGGELCDAFTTTRIEEISAFYSPLRGILFMAGVSDLAGVVAQGSDRTDEARPPW
ncbi:hypothetical protein BD779DRAFT_1700159 [Infundibulicybe gibba]|nr:hypothetical protein BD779DRAFT_1700159 [Infundibulicybe gibba]